MTVPTTVARPRLPSPPAPLPRVIERKRRLARLHLFTYVVGNAFFWILWAAIAITADHWYWWPVVPFAGWTIVLALHLRSTPGLWRR